MKILVTGGAGFIGSNFILQHIHKNQIINYDKLTYAGNIDNLKSLEKSPNYEFINGSINFSLKLKFCSDGIVSTLATNKGKN